jgi:putative heme transporter
MSAPALPVSGVGAGVRRLPWRTLLAAAVLAVLAVEVVLAAPTLGGAIASLYRARVGWLAAAVAAAAVSMGMFARTRRRLMAAAGVRVGLRDTLAAVYVANALHLTMPGGAAFSTAYTFRWLRSRGADGATSSWTLVSGAVVSTAALAGLGVVGSLLVGDRDGILALAVDGVVIAALVAVVLLVGRRPDLIVSGGRRLLAPANRLARRPPERGVTALERLVGQLRSVRPSAADWTLAGLFAVGNWVFDIACLAASAAALGVHGLTLPLLLIAYTAGMASSGLSPLPGGIGVVDTAMVLALVAGGIPAGTALPAVLLYRLISVAGVVAAGWLVAGVQARLSRRAPARGEPAREAVPAGT